MKRLAGLVLLALVCFPAHAAVHLMVIQEVFVGPPGDEGADLTPDARGQYVMLRMTARAEQFTTGTYFQVEDADGNLLGRFGTFTANMPTPGAIGCTYPACPAILSGTQAGKDLFSFNFDEIFNGQADRVALPVAAGRVCFMSADTIQVFDCVAWGDFDCTRSGNCAGANTARTGQTSGNLCDIDYGTPAAPGGLTFGHSLTRTTFSCPNKANSTQFTLAGSAGFPHPVNNLAASDNTDADADGVIDRLDCNDASNQEWWAAPGVRAVLLDGAPATTLSWAAQAGFAGPGVTYDVVRGDVADLRSAGDFTGASCFNASTPLATTADGDVPILSGDAFYYLVRGGSSAGCVGTYGAGRATANPICP